MVVQDKLEEHGLCTCFRYEPDPRRPKRDRANWRFFFETNLKLEKLRDLLGGYVHQYKVQLR
jgi:hypothetical protein